MKVSEPPQLDVIRELRVLDLDTECRPMHYSEFRPESQITAVAWSWVHSDEVQCQVLQQDLSNKKWMLQLFLRAYEQADVVTGHYLRKHDLPLLNDHCLRFGWGRLAPKLVQDTMDVGKVRSLGKSQDNLSVTLGVSAQKHHMAGAEWREANGLTPEGRAATRKRVVDDVIQHKQLRQALLDAGVLGPPKPWRA